MSAKPLCTICSLAYNHGLFIESHFESIWRQNYDNIEIIALDDGSSDNSAALLEECRVKSPFPMKVLRQVNSGEIAKNFNTLLTNASGDYIVFISCDDKLAEGAIASKIEAMQENDTVVFVASRKNYFIDHLNVVFHEDVLSHLDPTAVTTADDLFQLELESFGTFYIQGSVFRKKYVDAVGGFDDDLLGDDIVLRVKLFRLMRENPALSFSITEDFGFYYRLHRNNVHRNTERQVTLILQVLQRYYQGWPMGDAYRRLAFLALGGMPIADAIAALDFGPELYQVLRDRDVVKAINRCVMRQLGKQPLRKYFFKREYHHPYRTITLFSFITIKYKQNR